MISCAGAAGFGWTTGTSGTAICAVTVRRLGAALTRDKIPKARTAVTAAAVVKAMNQSRPERGRLFGCGCNGTILTLFSVCLISKLFILSPLLSKTYFADTDFLRHPCSRL